MAIVGVLIALLVNLGLWSGFLKLLMGVARWYDAVPVAVVGITALVVSGLSVALVERLLYAPGFGALAEKRIPVAIRR